MNITSLLLSLLVTTVLTVGAGASSGRQQFIRLDPTDKKVCVLGNVTNPSMVRFRDGMTVTQAIRDAGGVPKHRKSSKVRVHSLTMDGRNRIIYVDLERIRKKPYTDLELQSFDVVEVVFSARDAKNIPAPSNPCFSKPFVRID